MNANKILGPWRIFGDNFSHVWARPNIVVITKWQHSISRIHDGDRWEPFRWQLTIDWCRASSITGNAQQAKDRLDVMLIERGYMLLNSEEEADKYRLLL